MNYQTGFARCPLCQSDHFTSKCPEIVCVDSSIKLLSLDESSPSPPNPKNELNLHISSLAETLLRIEKSQRILFELSQDSKYEDRLQLIPKEWSNLNYLRSQLTQLEVLFNDFALDPNHPNGEIRTFYQKIAMSEDSILQLKRWIHHNTFDSGCFTNLNLSLVGPDQYLDKKWFRNVDIPVRVESNRDDLKRVGMVSLDGLPEEVILTTDFCNLLPDNTAFINVTVRENCHGIIKHSDVIKYIKALQKSVPEEVSTPSLKVKYTFCVFCKNNGEDEAMYLSHTLKGDHGRIRCPVLFKYQCPICGATGAGSHTIRYCPENKDAKKVSKRSNLKVLVGRSIETLPLSNSKYDSNVRTGISSLSDNSSRQRPNLKVKRLQKPYK